MAVDNQTPPISSNSNPDSIEDIVNFLGEETPNDENTGATDLLDDTGDKKAKEPKEKDDETETEDELELEDGAEEEPEIQEDEIVVPVSRKEILAKYPNIFKEFPQLEKSHYRARAYDELIGTIEDAKQLVEDVNSFKQLEQSIGEGNLDAILKTVADKDPAVFGKIVDNYLSSLAKVQPQAWGHVVGNVTKDTIMAMAKESQRTNNEELRQAALILNQFIFGTSEFIGKQTFGNQPAQDDPRRKELEQREQEFIKQKYEDAYEKIATKTDNLIRSSVTQAIDPKNVLTDYVKRTAISDVMKQLETEVGNDRAFQKLKDRLWKNAYNNDFDQTSLDKIRQAFLSKAKVVLPNIIKKSRNEALKGLGKRVADDDNTNRRRMNSGGGNITTTKKGEIPKGMRTVDYFMQD